MFSQHLHLIVILMGAGPGIEPRFGAYETPELPLLYPATYTGLGGKNRTCATCSQSTGDTISLHRENLLVVKVRFELTPGTV